MGGKICKDGQSKECSPAKVFKVAFNVAAPFVQVGSCCAHYVLIIIQIFDGTNRLEMTRKPVLTSLTRTSLSLLSSLEEE